MMMHQQDQPQHQQRPLSGNTIQLILVRHGIALHNIIHHHHHHSYHHQQQPQQTHGPQGKYVDDANLNVTDENYLFDPPLTADGKIQAAAAATTAAATTTGL
jgi:broad specificity phosphatase PhoE